MTQHMISGFIWDVLPYTSITTQNIITTAAASMFKRNNNQLVFE